MREKAERERQHSQQSTERKWSVLLTLFKSVQLPPLLTEHPHTTGGAATRWSAAQQSLAGGPFFSEEQRNEKYHASSSPIEYLHLGQRKSLLTRSRKQIQYMA